ncbi:MAG: archaeal heat shock protein Hsp20 [Archaeoglobaceae archaeon]
MDCNDDRCNPWKKKNLNRNRFNEIFGGFGDFDEMYERMLKEFTQTFKNPQLGAGPYVWGFSMKVGPDGKPVIKEFGNRPGLDEEEQSEQTGVTEEVQGARKPLVDVMRGEDEVSIIAEMPGVNKEDINVDASETNVELTAETKDRRYHETVELGAEVIPDSAQAKYNNGILEVVFKRKHKEEKKKIDID